jgi:hypothetical protein
MRRLIDWRPAPAVLAPVLLLIVPFWAFLHFHSYSVFEPAAAAISASLGLVGAALGWCVHRTRNASLAGLVMAGLMFVSADLAFDIGAHHKLVALILVALAWVLRLHLAKILIAMSLAYGASTLALGAQVADRISGEKAVRALGDQPPLLHLIADEHIGIDGIPTDVRGGAELKADLIAYYVGHGFRLFTKAYSEYSRSVDAIPNAVNFSARPTGFAWFGGDDKYPPGPLTRNLYFDGLARRGYAIRVYEPVFIDFCSATNAPPAFCFAVPANSMLHLPSLHLDWRSEVLVVAAYWVTNESSLYARAAALYNQRLRPALRSWGIAAPPWELSAEGLGPASALALLARLADDIEHAPELRGTALFAHVLLPHSPFLLDENCLGHPRFGKRSDAERSAAEFTPELRREQYERYLPQLRCLTREVTQLTALIDSRSGRDARIIVHGDHGSRIGRPPSVGAPLTREKFADFYSTLFAIRAPGVAPGVDTSVISMKDLLTRFSGDGSDGSPDVATVAPSVFVLAGKTGSRNAHLEAAAVPRAWSLPAN